MNGICYFLPPTRPSKPCAPSSSRNLHRPLHPPSKLEPLIRMFEEIADPARTALLKAELAKLADLYVSIGQPAATANNQYVTTFTPGRKRARSPRRHRWRPIHGARPPSHLLRPQRRPTATPPDDRRTLRIYVPHNPRQRQKRLSPMIPHFRPPDLRSFGFLGGDRGNWGGVNWLCKRCVVAATGR